MISLLSSQQQPDIHSFLIQSELTYFNNHFLQIVQSYPESIQSFHFTDLSILISFNQSSYLQQASEAIQKMNGDTVEMLVFYSKMVQVIESLSLPYHIMIFLLKPFQQAIHSQTNWIQSLFIMISRDYPVDYSYYCFLFLVTLNKSFFTYNR